MKRAVFISCVWFLHSGSPTLSTVCSQPMKIKPEQVDRLADRLLKNCRAKDLMILKTDEGAVRKRIAQIITQNFREEEAIEEEARKMLDNLAGQTKTMDQHKMFLMIKKKLAEKKGFILWVDSLTAGYPI